MTSPRRCKDCPPGTKRPVVEDYPGPRCATHKRAHQRSVSARAHERQIESKYTLTAAEYAEIYRIQGGCCGICQKATGKARRLAVDHDHELAKLHDHPIDRGCRLCIRGLLCRRCNRFGVPLFLPTVLRALEYLTNPPARKVLIDAA